MKSVFSMHMFTNSSWGIFFSITITMCIPTLLIILFLVGKGSDWPQMARYHYSELRQNIPGWARHCLITLPVGELEESKTLLGLLKPSKASKASEHLLHQLRT
jgi:hypothetical protein